MGATETITFGNGVDIINGFTAGTGKDSIDSTHTAVLTTAVGVNTTADNSATSYYLDGNYVAATGVFTGATTGADLLIWVGTAGSGLSAVDTFTVLVGVAQGDLHTDNFI